ncbi:MAG: hypothetical protein IPM25_15570 [Chloracidobacterium sp.]|nr:hypothetical protein [Chloracidobacterium sp.]
MTNEPTSIERLTRYLYGRVRGPELDAFEERLFTDSDLAAELDALENDLVDRYVAGEFGDAEAREFEQNYLVSERRAEKVRAARILSMRLGEDVPIVPAVAETTSFWAAFSAFFRPSRVAFAGGLAIAVISLAVGYLLWYRPPGERIAANDLPEIVIPTPAAVNALPTETPAMALATPMLPPAAVPAPSPAGRQPADPPPKKPAVLAFTLVPPIRSGSRPVLEIPGGEGSVRFRLAEAVDPRYTTYRVELRDGSGATVWDTEVGRSSVGRRGWLTVSVPRSSLKPGSYEMAVAGTTSEGSVEDVNFYNFVVRPGPEE